MPDRANDDAGWLQRKEDAVAADAGRPNAFHASDESFAHRFRLELDQEERFEHGFAHRVRERFELFLGSSRESELRQARARASPRPG